MKKPLFVTQAVIQILVGIGAAVSGMLLIIRPSGELLQAPVEMLKGSPFNDFFVPGIILFLVNGVGQLLAGVITLRRHAYAALTGAVFGIGLMIWVFVQVNMIGGGHILQYSYFFIGVIETSLAFMMGTSSTGSRGSIAASNGG
ncbi:MAG: hypothetical protein WB626_07870 [Bacteroidota bacterium]